MYKERSGTKITLTVDGVVTSWETKQWDCDATQLIRAFGGLMETQTFMPSTVYGCMRNEAQEMLECLSTEESEEKVRQEWEEERNRFLSQNHDLWVDLEEARDEIERLRAEVDRLTPVEERPVEHMEEVCENSEEVNDYPED